MRCGNFSVIVPTGRESVSGHVHLAHGSQYQIRLCNHWYDRRCDAAVEVDGKEIGVFRINQNGNVTLERGVGDLGKLTFFKVDSVQAQAAGVGEIEKDKRGLIQVTFRTEKKTIRYQNPSSYKPNIFRSTNTGPVTDGLHASYDDGRVPTCAGIIMPQSLSAGVTGLTGVSDQTFYEVPNLDYDETETVIVTIRLVADENLEVRPLKPVVRGNPVPETVE